MRCCGTRHSMRMRGHEHRCQHKNAATISISEDMTAILIVLIGFAIFISTASYTYIAHRNSIKEYEAEKSVMRLTSQIYHDSELLHNNQPGVYSCQKLEAARNWFMNKYTVAKAKGEYSVTILDCKSDRVVFFIKTAGFDNVRGSLHISERPCLIYADDEYKCGRLIVALGGTEK